MTKEQTWTERINALASDIRVYAFLPNIPRDQAESYITSKVWDAVYVARMALLNDLNKGAK